MADPALQTAALAGLEFCINQALALDPATSKRLQALHGKVLHIQCFRPDINVFFIPGEAGVKLKSWEDPALISSGLYGNFSDYIRLLQAQDKAAALINGAVGVKGDSADFIALQGILAELDVDWEQPLSRLLGDVGGHQLGRVLRATFAFGKDLRSSVHEQIEQHIQAEAGLLPTRPELDQFYSDIGKLTLRAERLQARIQRLAQRQRS